MGFLEEDIHGVATNNVDAMSRPLVRSSLGAGACADALRWVAGALAAALLVLTISSSPMMRMLKRRVAARREGPRDLASRGFQSLRGAVWGRTRREVANMLGVPPAAGGSARPDAPANFWNAEIWYYPLNPVAHTAVAIRFINDRACRIDLIGGVAREV